MKRYNYNQIKDRPLSGFSAADIQAAANAYAAELRGRVKQLSKLPRAQQLLPYQTLTAHGKRRPTIDVQPQRQGESVAEYRNRLLSEMARAKKFLVAKTSTRAGFIDYEHNVLKAIGKSVGLRPSQVKQLMSNEQIDQLFRLLEVVKTSVMMRYQYDSERVIDIAFDVALDKPDMPPAEQIKLIIDRVRQDGKTSATDSIRKSGDTYTKTSLRGRTDRRRRLAR